MNYHAAPQIVTINHTTQLIVSPMFYEKKISRHNFLTWVQPAVEFTLPELSQHRGRRHFGEGQIQKEVPQAGDDSLLDAKSDGPGTEGEPQQVRQSPSPRFLTTDEEEKAPNSSSNRVLILQRIRRPQ